MGMSTNCEPNSLAKASACYCGFSKEEAAAAEIFGLCFWATHLEPSEEIYWIPNTIGCRWNDGGPNHVEPDLASFLANANPATVLSLRVSDISITEIGNVGYLPALQTFEFFDCQMTSIDLSHNPNLVSVQCNSSGLLSLDVSNHLLLQALLCQDSPMKTLNCGGCPSLATIHCQECELGDLTITGCVALTELWDYANPQHPINPPLNVIT